MTLHLIRWYHRLVPGLASRLKAENQEIAREQRALADRYVKALGPIRADIITATATKITADMITADWNVE